MLGTIKCAHAAICLYPDDKILRLGIDLFSRILQFAIVAPINANKVNRTVGGVFGHEGEAVDKKTRVLPTRHFAGSLREFAVFDSAMALNIFDTDVVGRIREPQRSPVPTEPGFRITRSFSSE